MKRVTMNYQPRDLGLLLNWLILIVGLVLLLSLLLDLLDVVNLGWSYILGI
jgi:hypothetical protein